MIDYLVNFKKLEWESPMPGLRYKVKKQSGKQLRIVEYTKDMEPHWCEKGHYGYVLVGQLEIEFENETIVYKEGDGIFIPSGSAHKHMGRVITDLVRVIFVEEI